MSHSCRAAGGMRVARPGGHARKAWAGSSTCLYTIVCRTTHRCCGVYRECGMVLICITNNGRSSASFFDRSIRRMGISVAVGRPQRYLDFAPLVRYGVDLSHAWFGPMMDVPRLPWYGPEKRTREGVAADGLASVVCSLNATCHERVSADEPSCTPTINS